MIKTAIIISLVSFNFFSGALAQEARREVCFKDVCVSAEIADSGYKRQIGLMHRESLPAQEGMLFVFDNEDIYNFWMKDTFLPLDIIWISQDQKVVYILADVPVCGDDCPALEAEGKARYVLEVNAGFVKEHNIKVGDRVKF